MRAMASRKISGLGQQADDEKRVAREIEEVARVHEHVRLSRIRSTSASSLIVAGTSRTADQPPSGSRSVIAG